MHLAPKSLIEAANLPPALLLEYQSNPNHSFIPKDVMKKTGIQVQFANTTFDDTNQKMTTVLSLLWHQTPEGQFVTWNKPAQDAGLQHSVYLKTKAAMPYAWFTSEQLEFFRQRNASDAHLSWAAKNKTKDSTAYPQDLMIWAVCDFSYLYVPNNFRKTEKAHLLSIIPWESTVFQGFHNAEFNGFGLGTPAVECGKTTEAYNLSVWDNLLAVPDSLVAKTIQVTEAMKTAALPQLPAPPGSIKTVGAAPVLELPTVVAPPVLATPPQLPVPVVAAAPAVDPATLAAMYAALTPEQQKVLLDQSKAQQSII